MPDIARTGPTTARIPVIHALHRRHPDAQLRVLTHQPGDVLLQHDPAVAAVVHAERGRERAAVLAELDRWRPDLVVSTTRYDGIADAIEELAPQSVTNLWRSPPPDEPVSARGAEVFFFLHGEKDLCQLVDPLDQGAP